MPQTISQILYGKITKVTPDGRCGVVTLDQPHQTVIRVYKLAVIDDQTLGRIQMMNKNPSGRIMEGKEIKITSSIPGPESLRILQLEG